MLSGLGPWSVLVVDDDVGIRQSLRLCLEAAGGRVVGVGTPVAALAALERAAFDVVLLDLWLGTESGMSLLPELLGKQPGVAVVVITAFATYESAVEAMRRGATDYLPKPFTPDQVRLVVKRALDAHQLKRRVSELEEQLTHTDAPAHFDSSSPALRALLEQARRAAASEAPVLLRGESGTGKNILAQWIKAHSPRSDRPFVTVHCPTLSSELMSSTLFGHRRGAFTGATADALGKVQQAEGGTLFLDEVADLSPDAQARMLRFLNDQTFERVGDPHEHKANVRVIAATNRPLEALVSAAQFREDLFFRLHVLPLTLPPLRDRAEDLFSLAQHYLDHFARRQGRPGLTLSEGALAAIRAHRWPGNLRELRNAIERAVILSPCEVLEAADLGLAPSASSPKRPAVGGLVSLEALEREHIACVITQAPTLDAAAKVLGIDATTLSRKRKRYGLA
jgi:NtrC-family two-component system response regulator AlgB